MPRKYTCKNCHRSDVWVNDNGNNYANGEEYLQIQFTKVNGALVYCKRKWSHLSKIDICEREDVCLCKECNIAIATPEILPSIYRKPLHCWPSFVWNLFKIHEIRQDYGMTLWKLLPLQWQKWWLDSVQDFDEFDDVDILEPYPYFLEATKQYTRVLNAIDNLRWVELQNAIDELCSFPHVRCPWGCSEFFNQANHLPFDAVFASKLEPL